MTSGGSLRSAYCGLILLLALAVYLTATDRPLRDAEAKYAEVPREMLVLGDWTTPHLNFAPYLVKPPLTFWVTAGLYEVLGGHEWVARFANILWALLTAFLTGALAERVFGRGHGTLAAGVLLSTLGVYVYCLDAGIEFALIAFALLALIFFWDFYRSNSLLHLSLFYLALGLGFMAKGLPGIAIPGAVAVLFLLSQRQAARLTRLFHPLPVCVLLATISPWLILMTARHPEFLQVFFLEEHVGRFAGAMTSNDALLPTTVWLALVAAEFFPWTFHLPHLAAALPRMVRGGAVPAEKIVFLLIWAGLPLVLYSLSRSKVDFYGLNSYPALAILLSLPLRDVLGREGFLSARSWAYPWFVISPLNLVVLGLVPLLDQQGFLESHGLHSRQAVVVFLATTCVVSLGIALSFWTARVRLALVCLSVLMLTHFWSAHAMFSAAFPYRSMKFAADSFKTLAQESDLLVSDEGPEFEHVASLDYYTNRPVFLLRNREGSILHFLQHDQRAMCLDEPDLVRLSGEGRTIYLVGETERTSKRLVQLGLRFEAEVSSGDRTLFRATAPRNGSRVDQYSKPRASTMFMLAALRAG